MPKPVAEQVVVIVGASSGIGRASALAFARQGAAVVCAARTVFALESLVEEITAAGGRAKSVPTDVADPAAVRALADAAEQTYGRIDTWVNCAAIGIWGRVEDISDEEFDRVMRVNFLGQVHGVHAALPVMRRGGGGVLIGVSSVEGVRSVPLHAPYSASKFALRALYDSLRVELAQEGAPIAVTTILPASIDTPFFEHARSKVGAMPKPPPPVYAPEIVADAIVYASEHPRREIPVGGAAAGFILGQRFSPALTDALLSIPRLGAGSQRSGRPDNGTDNLDAPMAGTGRVHGAYPGTVLRRSVFTRVSRMKRPGELATTAVTLIRARTATQRKETDVTNTDGQETAAPITESPGYPVPNNQEPNPEAPNAGFDESVVVDREAQERKLSGWGGNTGPELTQEQADGLQAVEEPVADADFGELVKGDVGRGHVDSEPVEAPETITPDTRLGPPD